MRGNTITVMIEKYLLSLSKSPLRVQFVQSFELKDYVALTS